MSAEATAAPKNGRKDGHKGAVRGWHVLALILGFFAVIIAVNVGFAVVAVNSFPGEDVRRSYTQGLNYNETLADRRVQAALGWNATVALEPTPTGADVVVVLRDREGVALNNLSISGVLRWPMSQRFDQELSFAPRGEGVYVAHLEGLQRGDWRLRARAERADSAALDFEADLVWR